MTSLALPQNNLVGTLPGQLGTLSQLLDGCGWSNNSLSGQIPAELGNLTQLEWLYLAGNSLSGPIPSELGALSQLQGLYLAGNSLDWLASRTNWATSGS